MRVRAPRLPTHASVSPWIRMCVRASACERVRACICMRICEGVCTRMYFFVLVLACADTGTGANASGGAGTGAGTGAGAGAGAGVGVGTLSRSGQGRKKYRAKNRTCQKAQNCSLCRRSKSFRTNLSLKSQSKVKVECYKQNGKQRQREAEINKGTHLQLLQAFHELVRKPTRTVHALVHIIDKVCKR